MCMTATASDNNHPALNIWERKRFGRDAFGLPRTALWIESRTAWNACQIDLLPYRLCRDGNASKENFIKIQAFLTSILIAFE